jgi:hypothetical protein
MTLGIYEYTMIFCYLDTLWIEQIKLNSIGINSNTYYFFVVRTLRIIFCGYFEIHIIINYSHNAVEHQDLFLLPTVTL